MGEPVAAGSRVPRPEPVRLESATTAVLVLDVIASEQPPDVARQQLLTDLGVFLDRARQSRVPVIFTGTRREIGVMPDPQLKRREDESMFWPDGFDKFIGGDLQRLLEERNARTLVVTGGAANVAVMYTVTGAARTYHYSVVVPLDGVYSADAYRYEYALYQLTVLPGGATIPRFSTLSKIEFL